MYKGKSICFQLNMELHPIYTLDSRWKPTIGSSTRKERSEIRLFRISFGDAGEKIGSMGKQNCRHRWQQTKFMHDFVHSLSFEWNRSRKIDLNIRNHFFSSLNMLLAPMLCICYLILYRTWISYRVFTFATATHSNDTFSRAPFLGKNGVFFSAFVCPSCTLYSCNAMQKKEKKSDQQQTSCCIALFLFLDANELKFDIWSRHLTLNTFLFSIDGLLTKIHENTCTHNVLSIWTSWGVKNAVLLCRRQCQCKKLNIFAAKCERTIVKCCACLIKAW